MKIFLYHPRKNRDQSKLIEKKNFITLFAKISFDNNDIKHYSRNTSLDAVFAGRFNRTIRDLFKRPVFEKCDGNWVDILSTITKQNNNRVHSSTKLPPILASLKENEGYVQHNLLDKRKKIKPKLQVDDLVRTAVFRKTFSKSDTTNWSSKLYKNSEIIIDTIPSYRIDNLSERYNEALLKKKQLPLEENENVMESLNLN